ncbi:class I SAM-dependent methyltransferase [Roseivirga sp.]|uniref:class I SAM-dependent methyltransferase n=1 Tax=Roseivirga sp. TaxID=1964215 RepID=UPI003B8B7521
MSSNKDSKKILSVITELKEEVLNSGNKSDLDYFNFHEVRFFRMAKSVLSRIPLGSKVLDIGSHFLHSSIILKKLGYDVSSMDIQIFWDISFVKSRAEQFDLEPVIENNLETFKSMGAVNDEFDLIVFTEIFEHITFNPVHFWNSIYRITKSNGSIYLTTPNSLALPNLLRSCKNLLLLKGIGLQIPEILNYVTYGHHWKEYSRKEIKQYFSLISDDFKLSIDFFEYQKVTKDNGIRGVIWSTLLKVGTRINWLAPNIEAIIRIEKVMGLKMKPPKYH